MLINAYSIFVPGLLLSRSTHSNSTPHNIGKIYGWRVKSLQIKDLAKFNLLGLSKQVLIPVSVEKYASIFDFEAQTLRTPPYIPYKGDLIGNLVKPKHTWPVRNSRNPSSFLLLLLFPKERRGGRGARKG